MTMESNPDGSFSRDVAGGEESKMNNEQKQQGVFMNRFDYVQYDELAGKTQAALKEEFRVLEDMVDKVLTSPRAKALVLTKLEEAYMWVGKAIRDDQIKRNGAADLQEHRANG